MRHLCVADLMTRLVVTLRPTDTVLEAAEKLSREHVSGAPVSERGAVIGIVSESDVMTALRVDQRQSSLSTPHRPLSKLEELPPLLTTVADIMTGDVVSVVPDTPLVQAADLMSRKRINRLPVVGSDGSLLGIISRSDLVRAMARVDLFEILGQPS